MPFFYVSANAFELDLPKSHNRKVVEFQPEKAGEVILRGEWEGGASSLDVALYSPQQWFAKWRGSVKEEKFELSWTFEERDLDSERPWKFVIRPRSGGAKGEFWVEGAKVTKETPPSKYTSKDRPSGGFGGAAIIESEQEQMPLDAFGAKVRETFLNTAHYKPWLEQAVGKNPADRLILRPLELAVTPTVRRVSSRYGKLAVTIRNITLTPAQNVQIGESISGGSETVIELLAKIEIPGWYLFACAVKPFQAITGEEPRVTAMQTQVKSVSMGPLADPSSFPLLNPQNLLLVPMQLSTPGEYVVTIKPIAKEPAEVLFNLGVIELFRL